MKWPIRCFMSVGILAFAVSATALAQESEPAEMMATPYFSKPQYSSDDYKVVSPEAFSTMYKNAKEPTVMVFLGRSFSSFVSDWQADSRVQVNSEIKSESKDLPKTVTTDASVQTRHYADSGRSTLHSDAEWNAIEQGFRETLLNYRVRMLQQNLATRLLDAELRQSSNRLPQNDNLRLETDVLRKHSKLLIEITPYPESRQFMQKVGYQITVSSLTSATVVAEKRFGIRMPQAEYRAGNNGYERQEIPVNTEYLATDKGYEAIRTYQDLNYENGKALGLALIDVLYQTGLAGIQ